MSQSPAPSLTHTEVAFTSSGFGYSLRSAPKAQNKYAKLCVMAEDARQAVFTCGEDIKALSRKDVLSTKDRIRLDERQKQHPGLMQTSGTLNQLLNRVRAFVTEHDAKGTVFADAGRIRLTNRKVSDLVRRLAILRDERKTVLAAKVTADTVKERARAILQRTPPPKLNDQGELYIPPVERADFGTRSYPLPSDQSFAKSGMMLGLAWALSPKAVLDLVDRLAEQDFPKEGLSELDRRTRVRELDDEVLAIERELEGHAEHGEARRAEANPLAVLNVIFSSLGTLRAEKEKRKAEREAERAEREAEKLSVATVEGSSVPVDAA